MIDGEEDRVQHGLAEEVGLQAEDADEEMEALDEVEDAEVSRNTSSSSSSSDTSSNSDSSSSSSSQQQPQRSPSNC